MRHRGERRRDPEGSPPHIEVLGTRADAGPGSGPPEGPGLVLWGAVLAGLVALVLAIAGSGDPDPVVEEDPAPETAGGTEAMPSTDDELAVAARLEGDRVVVRARSASGVAPWVAFEICAEAPAGCAPLWTADLSQEGSTSTAELRPIGAFRSPGGHLHDCGAGTGCRVWVITDVGAAALALPPGPTTSVEAPSAPRERAELLVSVPDTVVDGESFPVGIVGASAGEPYTLAVCVADVGWVECPVVHEGVAGDDGRDAVELRLPRRLAHRASDDTWPVHDCASDPCRLVVQTSTAAAVVEIPFASTIGHAPPSLRLGPPGASAVGDIVTLEGSGFVRVSDAVPGRASWVLCDRRPERLEDVPRLCATPRTVREPVIDRNGTFALSLLVPDPSVMRTWSTREPLTCATRCWLVVLAEPFPEVAAVPIEVGGR